MANPELFKSIEIGPFKELFVDAGVKCNNPLAHVLSEVKQIYPDREVASIVSLGAGHARTIEAPRSGWSLVHSVLPTNFIVTTKNVATDSERVAEEMASRFREMEGVYFRFNVDQGLQNVELAEWEKLGQVATHTRSYTSKAETKDRIDRAGKSIWKRIPMIATAAIAGQAPSNAVSRMVSSRYPAPTPIFTGHTDEINQILKCLVTERPQRRVCVVHGLGGSGKTQLVLKAIEQSEDRWTKIIYVDSSSTSSIEGSLQKFAPAKNSRDTYEAALSLLGSRREQWLIVFDNADEPGLGLQKYFPNGNHGSIVITTRQPGLAIYASETSATLNVTRMKPEEALDLLVKLSRRKIEQEQLPAAQGLLEEFEYFALAIVQAGAYIGHRSIEFSTYKKLFLSRKKETLEQFTKLPNKPDAYSETVYTTWIMCHDLLGPDARQVLAILGYLYHNGITENLFRRAALNLKRNPRPWYLSNDGQMSLNLDPEERTALEFTSQLLLNEIASLSLIEPDLVNDSYSIHLLVQDWARTVAKTSEMNALECAAAILALSIWPDDNNDTSEQIFRRSLDLHVNAIEKEKGDSLGVHHAAAFSEVYYDKGLFEKSKYMRLRVLKAECSRFGEEDSITLKTMSHLATTCWELRQFDQAKELHEKVYNIQLAKLGPNHPDTLDAKMKLVSTYSSMGRIQESNALLGDIMTDPTNLQQNPRLLGHIAQSFYTRRDYARAEQIDNLNLKLLEKSFGENNPVTLGAMSNLASTYAGLGRFHEAEKLDQRALEIQKVVLGTQHPETLQTMENLTSTYASLGKISEAERLGLEVLSAYKHFDEKSVRTLRMATSLLRLYKGAKRPTKAKEMEKEVERLKEIAGPVIVEEARKMAEQGSA
ncbi:Nephrocystin-3 [Mus musculus] [Rhizoctonia solani]|uniref:Nephrocystin-3 [Mus musculus] n=1 Tax=Rhizoctonia solani TaxID=456999 RepID=A0A0K6FR29_9AGAM|nr:Nephrocystin-3 [Mus musculus] [Rhizoctonia solani]